ncbi:MULTISPECIES: hypothetical protein [unclassified Streptomyces]
MRTPAADPSLRRDRRFVLLELLLPQVRSLRAGVSSLGRRGLHGVREIG